MGRTKEAIAVMALGLGASTAAMAQPASPTSLEAQPEERLADHFNQPYRVVFALERVLVLSPYTQTGAHDSGGLSLGLGPYLRTLDSDALRPFLPQLGPRLMVDLQLPEQLTIGAGIGFGLSAAEVEPENSELESRTHTSTTAVLEWRLGYVAPIEENHNAVFWPRVGVSYGWGGGELPDNPYATERIETWAHNTQANVELGFVFLAARHIALTLCLHADFGVDGTSGTTAVREGLGEPEESEALRLHDAVGVSLGVLSYL